MEKIIINQRRCGNTTRQVDQAIQTLFTTGEVLWKDHAHRIGNMAQEHGWKILLRRLEFEHNLRSMFKMAVDPVEYKIKLIND